MIEGKRNRGKKSFHTYNKYKTKVLEGFGLIQKHRKVVQKEKKWVKTSKSPVFRGGYQVPNMRW